MRALGPCRFSEARFTGAFPFARWTGEGCSPADPESLERIARDVRNRLEQQRTPDLLADAGLLALLAGRFDAAIASFEKAVELEPRNPARLSDLAAAYLTRSGRPGDSRPTDFLRALLFLDQARAASHPPLEARFNWALALKGASLGEQARVALQEYLRTAPHSPWAAEVRAALRDLCKPTESEMGEKALPALDRASLTGDAAEVQRIVARFPQPALTYVEERLLPEWAAAQAAGRFEAAARALRIARSVGAALATRGDHQIEEAVAAIDHARGDSQRSGILTRGYLAYAEGIRLARVLSKDPEALQKFEEAARSFAAGFSPSESWAAVWAGNCEFYLGLAPQALDRLTPLRRKLDPGRQPHLLGLLLLNLGMTSGRLGNFSASQAAYEAALQSFLRLGERGNVAAAQFMLGEILRYQGETERSWGYRQRALHLASRVGNPIYIHNTLLDSAEAALQQGLSRVALLYHNEMVARGQSERDDFLAAESLLRRSRTYERLGEIDAALADLLDAREVLSRIPESPRRAKLADNLDMATGEVELGRNPARAVAVLNSVIAFNRDRQANFRLPQLYFTRAKAYLAEGKREEGEADLAASLAEAERQREHVFDDELRISYGDQTQEIFATMVRLQVELGRADRAFDYVEQARTRNLLEALPGAREAHSAGEPALAQGTLSAAAVRRELRPDVALVEYAVASDRTLVWVLRKDRLRLLEIPISRETLARQVEGLDVAIGRIDALETRHLSGDLYDLLVRPLARDLEGASTLVVSPDQALYRLPFAALLRREVDRYLIEDFGVLEAPSATLFVKASQRSRDLPWHRGSALLVGNPAIDLQAFPDLGALGGAGAEVQALAALYPGAVPLEGPAATKAAFLAEAPRREVIHLASHAQINSGNPLLSAFALAPGRARGGFDSGAFYAYEIYRLHFDRTRLVVLAGCGTAGGGISASEGMSSLARPFLAAGVPSVLASLWSIDDRAAASFFVAFHRALQRGEDPAQALRKSQLSMLHGEDPVSRRPALWAPFVVLGGLP